MPPKGAPQRENEERGMFRSRQSEKRSVSIDAVFHAQFPLERDGCGGQNIATSSLTRKFLPGYHKWARIRGAMGFRNLESNNNYDKDTICFFYVFFLFLFFQEPKMGKCPGPDIHRDRRLPCRAAFDLAFVICLTLLMSFSRLFSFFPCANPFIYDFLDCLVCCFVVNS